MNESTPKDKVWLCFSIAGMCFILFLGTSYVDTAIFESHVKNLVYLKILFLIGSVASLWYGVASYKRFKELEVPIKALKEKRDRWQAEETRRTTEIDDLEEKWMEKEFDSEEYEKHAEEIRLMRVDVDLLTQRIEALDDKINGFYYGKEFVEEIKKFRASNQKEI